MATTTKIMSVNKILNDNATRGNVYTTQIHTNKYIKYVNQQQQT